MNHSSLADDHSDEVDNHPLLSFYRHAATEQPPESLDALMQAAYRRGMKKRTASSDEALSRQTDSAQTGSDPLVARVTSEAKPSPLPLTQSPLPTIPRPAAGAAVPIRPRPQRSRPFAQSLWQLPVGLAAGILVMMGMPWMTTYESSDIPSEQQVIMVWAGIQTDIPMPNPPQTLIPRGLLTESPQPGDPQTPSAILPSDPQHWLDTIALLIMKGRLQEADTLLKAFKQRYPDYSAVRPANK